MRKYIILIFIFFVVISNALSQINVNKSDTCFTEQEVIDIANKMYELKQKDSINTVLINKQSETISLLKSKVENDSIMMSLYNTKFDIKDDKIKFYKESYEYYKKRSNYMFISGVGAVLVSSLVLHFSLN